MDRHPDEADEDGQDGDDDADLEADPLHLGHIGVTVGGTNVFTSLRFFRQLLLQKSLSSSTSTNELVAILS